MFSCKKFVMSCGSLELDSRNYYVRNLHNHNPNLSQPNCTDFTKQYTFA